MCIRDSVCIEEDYVRLDCLVRHCSAKGTKAICNFFPGLHDLRAKVRAHLPSFAVTNRIRQRAFDSSISLPQIIPLQIYFGDKFAKICLYSYSRPRNANNGRKYVQ